MNTWNRLPRWQRCLVALLLAWSGVCLLMALAIPRWVQQQIQAQGTAVLGRSVTVEQVRFYPWSMTLVLRGLRVGPAHDAGADAPAVLRLDELRLNAAWTSLLHAAPVADEVVLLRPQLKLVHLGEGHFDVDDILLRLTQPAAEPRGGMPRFSLFNVRIEEGQAQWEDASRGLSHRVDGVTLQIPFVSNIDALREVSTHPRLAFKLDGIAFDSDAETAPFSTDHRTQVHLQVHDFNVQPYLPYWPAVWPWRLRQGRADLDLTLKFKQETTPELALSGRVALKDVVVHERPDQATDSVPWLQWQTWTADVQAWRPLENVLQISETELTQPVLHVRRDGQGRLNWQRWPPLQNASAPAQTQGAWGLAKLKVHGGQWHWHDATTRTPVQWVWRDVGLTAQNLAWPASGLARFEGQASPGAQGAAVTWQGDTDGQSAKVQLQLKALPLQMGAPYWAEFLRPELGGLLSAQVAFDWKAAAEGQPGRSAVTAKALRISDFSLGPVAQPDVSWRALDAGPLHVDLATKRVRVDKLVLTQAMLRLFRHADGHWSWEDLLQNPSPEPPPDNGQDASREQASVAPRPWQWHLGALQLGAGQIQLQDLRPGASSVLTVDDVSLSTGALSSAPAAAQSTPFRLGLRMAGAQQTPGTGWWDGQLHRTGSHWSEATLQGQLRVDNWPLHALGPYLTHGLDVQLQRAWLHATGSLSLAGSSQGLGMNWQGDLALERLRALTRSTQEPLLSSKALNLQGVLLDVQQGALRRLEVSETAVSDFFVRVAVDPAGHLNWQQLRPGLVQADADLSPATTPVILLGPVAFVNGRVDFSDRFIQPNYATELSELTGHLSAISNQVGANGMPALADLSVRGRAAGSASLEVNGQINPFTHPMGLDLRGQVRDVDLPQLSAYSAKYAGYGIERGKLSAQLRYRVDAQGQLKATHQIVLNQLAFGDRVQGSAAPDLPLKLAVSLLKDRHGVIDINLPVSGALDDPDFQVGAIVWKMVLSLVGKALTSPLNLMAGLWNGSSDLHQLAFAEGSAQLKEEARKQLDAVAKVLLDKPGISVTAAGHSDWHAEREAYRQIRLQEMLALEKRRRARAAPDEAVGPVTADEYPLLLQEVYRRANVPKPRNVLGVVQDISQADMASLLLASVVVGENEMRALADARAVAVRQYLWGQQVSKDQIFLGAAVVNVDEQTRVQPQVVLSVSAP